MTPASATLYSLEIPFVEAFTHGTKDRTASDAIVVQVTDTDGNVGYGEGLPRPYVTGESVSFLMEHVAEVLWPKVAGKPFKPLESTADIAQFDSALGTPSSPGIRAPNASRCSLEIALLDCALRAQNMGVGELLPPLRQEVRYDGVLTAADPTKAAKIAKQMKLIGLEQFKIKVGLGEDEERIRRVREVLGTQVPLRVDANGTWHPDEAADALRPLAALGVTHVEAPIPCSDPETLASLDLPCDIVVDEYLVTLDDARALAELQACQVFNVRLSKLGGVWRSLQVVEIAHAAGIGIQVGSQVGETAILSAAGRHLAASLPKTLFVEGSYGSLLLTEDISREPVSFGYGGLAPVFKGPGLGVTIREDLLKKYAKQVTHLRWDS